MISSKWVELAIGIAGVVILAHFQGWWIAGAVACIAVYVKGIKM